MVCQTVACAFSAVLAPYFTDLWFLLLFALCQGRKWAFIEHLLYADSLLTLSSPPPQFSLFLRF